MERRGFVQKDEHAGKRRERLREVKRFGRIIRLRVLTGTSFRKEQCFEEKH